MRRVMMILLAVLSAAAMSAIGASAAGAVTGSLSIVGSTCDVTFDATGAPTDPTPNSIFVDNINEAPGCAFDVKNPASYMDLDFDGSGNVTAGGTLSVVVAALGGITCRYDVTNVLVSGTNTATTATIGGNVNKSLGGFLCPNPSPMAMQLDRLVGSFLMVGSAACDITFAATGGPTDPTPNDIIVDNVNEATGCPFDVKNPASYVDLQFDGSGNFMAGGVLSLAIAAAGGATCTYSVPTALGANTATTARFGGQLSKTTGGFLCPDPLDYKMRVEGL